MLKQMTRRHLTTVPMPIFNPSMMSVLIKLRQVSTRTILGESISRAAWECDSEEKYNQIINQIKEMNRDNPRMIGEILGESTIKKIC